VTGLPDLVHLCISHSRGICLFDVLNNVTGVITMLSGVRMVPWVDDPEMTEFSVLLISPRKDHVCYNGCVCARACVHVCVYPIPIIDLTFLHASR
jgi:hypothetical protein